jgi:prevent-host-death family protein
MQVTITEFRKNLFQIMERALNGEFVEINHKGQRVRLVPQASMSKLDRLVAHDSINGTYEDLEAAQQELSAEMQAGLDREIENLK